MKTFADLVHNPHPAWQWTQATEDFENWYGISVIKSMFSYGGREGLYEMAIFHGWSLCYDTPITDDALGNLTENDVTEYLKQVQELPPKAEPQSSSNSKIRKKPRLSRFTL